MVTPQPVDTHRVKIQISRRFMQFLVVGVICTTTDFVLFALCHDLLYFSIILSNIISYGSGLTLAFFINRSWTFADSTKRSKRLLLLSLALGYVGLILNTALVWMISAAINVYLAKVLAVLVVLFYNYFTNKYWVFRVAPK